MDRTLRTILDTWGSKDEEARRKRDPCKQPPMLKEQLNAFKKAARKVNLHTVNEEQTWRLGTCYVQRNRLMNAAIHNRQSAIRGMPIMTKEDAEGIMQTLLALRGVDKKASLEAWKMVTYR